MLLCPTHSGYGGGRVWPGPCGCAGVCFESVTVSSPEAVAAGVQAARFGTYTKVPNLTQGDRPVYQRVGYTVMFLFHWPSTSRWLLGSNYTSGSSSVRSSGNAGAACPDQATGWQAYTGGAWVSTYPITVVPTSPTTAAPATVGKRSRCVRSRSGASRARIHCRFQVPQDRGVAAGQRRAIAAADPPLWLFVCVCAASAPPHLAHARKLTHTSGAAAQASPCV